MKPIEPGCLVVILHAKCKYFVGASGTVRGKNNGCPVSDGSGNARIAPLDWWDVEVDGLNVVCRPACDLLRIDDYDASADETQKQNEVAA